MSDLFVTRGKDGTKLKAPGVALAAGGLGAVAIMMARGKYDKELMYQEMPSKEDKLYKRDKLTQWGKAKQTIRDINNTAREGIALGSRERQNQRYTLTDFGSGVRKADFLRILITKGQTIAGKITTNKPVATMSRSGEIIKASSKTADDMVSKAGNILAKTGDEFPIGSKSDIPVPLKKTSGTLSTRKEVIEDLAEEVIKVADDGTFEITRVTLKNSKDGPFNKTTMAVKETGRQVRHGSVSSDVFDEYWLDDLIADKGLRKSDLQYNKIKVHINSIVTYNPTDISWDINHSTMKKLASKITGSNSTMVRNIKPTHAPIRGPENIGGVFKGPMDVKTIPASRTHPVTTAMEYKAQTVTMNSGKEMSQLGVTTNYKRTPKADRVVYLKNTIGRYDPRITTAGSGISVTPTRSTQIFTGINKTPEPPREIIQGPSKAKMGSTSANQATHQLDLMDSRANLSNRLTEAADIQGSRVLKTYNSPPGYNRYPS
jgi:hypothetical protein